ncbi:hypothetical protein NY78_3504 [Desulfovibrio sp. TomC]|nr:hypothetical protein NY78_3504 [Desulfovibrio sp. TomC]
MHRLTHPTHTRQLFEAAKRRLASIRSPEYVEIPCPDGVRVTQ